eukprot:TRINITY_DN2428_c0_g1_i10.p1 TRINITY_DN2428_c0_g1~~TRINITY_DN2428_c0_g1_i10.p1  ORF type:complete len:535 (-),score=101.88 TRINITY_DN2428_c0_g1_i10:1004-2608(-)
MWRLHIVFVIAVLLVRIQHTSGSSVNIGALFSVDSVIGRVAKTAIELAVDDVNSREDVLNGTRIQLFVLDSSCNVFVGTEAAFELMEKNMAAIIGPQSSVVAHVVSYISTQLQIPLLSFAATDPTLTSYEYPYFIRTAHSDYFQMRAIADFVGHFNWKEVVAIYADNEYGRNGIGILGDALLSAGAQITRKEAMAPGIDAQGMKAILEKMLLMETRVFVVHMNSDEGLKLFSTAKRMGMVSSGFVWIVTDWLSSALDSGMLEPEGMSSLQGLVALRPYFPNSRKLSSFKHRWKNLQKEKMVNVSLNSFGMYAYDCVWMMAYALDTFFNQGGTLSFLEQANRSKTNESKKSGLASLKVLDEGPQLGNTILDSKFDGVTGSIQLDSTRNLMVSAFEIINVVGTGFRTVGYWSDKNGLSVTPPKTSGHILRSHVKPQLYDIIWPGESKSVPRGWVLPERGREFVIGVPRKGGFKEFVSIADDGSVEGFCVDVFAAAAKLLPYSFQYKFEPYGIGNSTPNYNQLVGQLAVKSWETFQL